MDIYCSNCEKPVINPEIDDVTDGYLYSCPECGGPVAFVEYEECECGCGEVVVELSTDEKAYVTHLINKQLEKLNNAIDQLINVKNKLGGYDDTER